MHLRRSESFEASRLQPCSVFIADGKCNRKPPRRFLYNILAWWNDQSSLNWKYLTRRLTARLDHAYAQVDSRLRAPDEILD